jgi:hypothetical protein
LVTRREIEFFSENGGRKMKKLIQNFSIERPDLSYGIIVLIRMRAGSYWTGERLSIIKKINEEYLNVCPFCRMEKTENIFHYIAECNAWKSQRRKFFDSFVEINQRNVKIVSVPTLKLLSSLVGDEKDKWYDLIPQRTNHFPNNQEIDNILESLLNFLVHTSMERFNRLFPPFPL